MNEIKDLEKIGRKETVLFHKENTVTNLLTGEVSEVGRTLIKRAKSRDNFIKLFVENIDFLVRLDSQEKTLFFYMLVRVDYNNIVSFDSSLKHSLISKKVMGRTSMYKALQGLLDKKVIYEIDEKLSEEITNIGMKDCYLLNPNLVGRGSWNELKKLRHTIKRETDFTSFELKQRIEIEAVYEGLDEVLKNPEQYKVDMIEHKASEDGRMQDLNILINEKEKVEIQHKDTQPSLFTATQDNNIIDVELNTIDSEENPNLLPNTNIQSSPIQQMQQNNIEMKKEDKSLELLREQGRVKALELELKNKEIELLKLKLKERLISEGKIEEALNI